MSNNDLELTLRLKADKSGFVGEVKDATKEVSALGDTAGTAADHIDGLATAENKTSTATDTLNKATNKNRESVNKLGDTHQRTGKRVHAAADHVDGLASSENKATTATDKLNAATKKAAAATAKLNASAKKAAAATAKLNASAKKAAAATAKLNASAKKAAAGVKGLGDAHGKAAKKAVYHKKSTKELQFALRGIPAQFTDITVSLASGQNPLTVMLQQGGQLKDMFGGVGAALRAMGGYALSLINPFTIAAVVVGGLSAAFLVGNAEARAYQRELILTGDYADITAKQLQHLAQNFDAVEGTERAAAKALTIVVSTGKFAGQQIEQVAAAALNMHRATGKAVEDTVAEFEALAKAPAKAIVELNEKQHFLTASVYEQITALVQQGKHQAAVTLAMDTYSNTVTANTKDIEKNLGAIQKLWAGIKSGSASAIDGLLAVGRTPVDLTEIEAAQTRVDQLELWFARSSTKQLRINFPAAPLFVDKDAELAQLQATIVLLKQQKEEKNTQQVLDEKAFASIDKINTLRLQSLSIEKKRLKAVAEYKANIEAIRAANPNSTLLDEKRIREDIAHINKQFNKTAAAKNSAAQRIILALSQQHSIATEQLNTNQKLTASQRTYVAFELRIASIKSKDILTAEEQSLLNNHQAISAQYQKNMALDAELAKHQQIERVQAKALSQLQSMQRTAALGSKSSNVQRVQYDIDNGDLDGLSDDKKTALIEGARELDTQLAQEKLTRMREQWLTESDLRQAEYDQQLLQLEQFHNQKYISDEQYEQSVTALKADHARKQRQNEMQARINMMGNLSQLFEGMAGLAEAAKGKQSAAYKAMFAVSKSFSVAESLLSVWQAAAHAMTDKTAITPAQKIANYALVAGAGLNAVQTIQSVGMQGQAHEGISRVPRHAEGTWLVKKNERIYTNESANQLDRMYTVIMGLANAMQNARQVSLGSTPSSNQNIGVSTVRIVNESGEQLAISRTSTDKNTEGERLTVYLQAAKNMVVSELTDGGEIAAAGQRYQSWVQQ